MERLIYGITGNTAKDELWPLVQRLKNWMDKRVLAIGCMLPLWMAS